MNKQIAFVCPFCKQVNTPEIELKTAYTFTEYLKCEKCNNKVYVTVMVKTITHVEETQIQWDEPE